MRPKFVEKPIQAQKIPHHLHLPRLEQMEVTYTALSVKAVTPRQSILVLYQTRDFQQLNISNLPQSPTLHNNDLATGIRYSFNGIKAYNLGIALT